jgi:hypothetical protein
VVKAVTPNPPSEADLMGKWAAGAENGALVAVGRFGPAGRAAAPRVREHARIASGQAVVTLVRFGETADLLPEKPATVIADAAKAAEGVKLDPGMSAGHREFTRVAHALARFDVRLAEPARPALWALLRAKTPTAGLALKALATMGPVTREDEAWMLALAQEEEDVSWWRAFLAITGSEPATHLAKLAGPDGLRSTDDDWWLPIGLRVGKDGVVPAEFLARKDVPDSFRVGYLRGAAQAAAEAGRLRAALQALADTAKHADALGKGDVVKTFATFPESPPFPEVAPKPELRLEMRVRAVEVLAAQGAAAKSAVPTVEALLQDPDPRVRWRAHRALRAIR